MTKQELLQRVREAMPGCGIKFPRDIGFGEHDNVLTLTMQGGVAKNMQGDSAAFEGWTLCLKAIPELEVQRVCLTWEKPEGPKAEQRQHYQRFLYRVEKFKRLFGGENGWFCLSHQSEGFLSDLEPGGSPGYVLNSASARAGHRGDPQTEHMEDRLENEILCQQQQKHLPDLAVLCPAELQSQLPVGLFHGEVKQCRAVFPCKRGAVDLWGVDGDKLYVLELKAKGNCKVGVLSEIFFYAMVLRDEQHRVFVRETKGGEQSKEGRKIQDTKHIKAFILAPDLHPLVTTRVLDLINEKTRSKHMEFGHISFRYDLDAELRPTLHSFQREYPRAVDDPPRR